MARYMISGKFLSCFKLADKWAPEAIQAANKGLSVNSGDYQQDAKSCASEVIRKMGGSDSEMAIVAGLAGGIGLSGYGCGAISAALWKTTLIWNEKNPGKNNYPNPASTKPLKLL